MVYITLWASLVVCVNRRQRFWRSFTLGKENEEIVTEAFRVANAAMLGKH